MSQGNLITQNFITFSGIKFANIEIGVKMKHKIFNDLFVLEIAYNHWESLDRGIKIIRGFFK